MATKSWTLKQHRKFKATLARKKREAKLKKRGVEIPLAAISGDRPGARQAARAARASIIKPQVMEFRVRVALTVEPVR